MKKKLALLLVLAMVLSAIPMNVFGRSYVSPENQNVNTNTSGRWLSTTLWVDVAEFINRTDPNITDFKIDLRLDKAVWTTPWTTPTLTGLDSNLNPSSSLYKRFDSDTSDWSVGGDNTKNAQAQALTRQKSKGAYAARITYRTYKTTTDGAIRSLYPQVDPNDELDYGYVDRYEYYDVSTLNLNIGNGKLFVEEFKDWNELLGRWTGETYRLVTGYYYDYTDPETGILYKDNLQMLVYNNVPRPSFNPSNPYGNQGDPYGVFNKKQSVGDYLDDDGNSTKYMDSKKAVFEGADYLGGTDNPYFPFYRDDDGDNNWVYYSVERGRYSQGPGARWDIFSWPGYNITPLNNPIASDAYGTGADTSFPYILNNETPKSYVQFGPYYPYASYESGLQHGTVTNQPFEPEPILLSGSVQISKDEATLADEGSRLAKKAAVGRSNTDSSQPGVFEYIFEPLNGTDAQLTIKNNGNNDFYVGGSSRVSSGSFPQTMYVGVPLYYYFTGDDDTDTATVTYWSYTNNVNISAPLNLAGKPATGLVIGDPAPEKVKFYQYAKLNPIAIREKRRGDLSVGYHWFRFEAEEDYVWDPSLDNARIDRGVSTNSDDKLGYSTVYGNAQITVDGSSRYHVFTETINGAKKSVLYLQLHIISSTAASSGWGWPETLKLENLMLIADDRAKFDDVKIDARYIKAESIETISTSTSTNIMISTPLTPAEICDNLVFGPEGNYNYGATITPDYAEWRRLINAGNSAGAKTLIDAFIALINASGNSTSWPTKITYPAAALSYDWSTLSSDGVRVPYYQATSRWNSATSYEITVAERVKNQVIFDLVPGGSPKEVTSGRFKQLTEKMMLAEIAPNAWGATSGIDVTFTVDEGVKIQRARILYNTNYPTRKYGDGDGWTWYDVTEDFVPKNGVLVKNDYVKYTSPLQNKEDLGKLRHLYLQLEVSVEAGYEWKYETQNITVTAKGGSLSNLEGDDFVVPALAVDPILPPDVDITDIITNNTSYYADKEVGSITITEQNVGALKRDSYIWLYVVGARTSDVELYADVVAETNNKESGLELARGSSIKQAAGNLSYVGMSYKVTHESNKKDVPGEIIVNNVSIRGWIYPEVDYRVVISGSAVAENDYLVYHTANSSVSAAQEEILFDAPPYESSLVAFEDTDTSGRPGGTGGGDMPTFGGGSGDSGSGGSSYEPAPTPLNVTFSTSTSVYVANGIPVEWPFRIPESGPGKNCGYIAPRAFVAMVGLDDPVWDPTTGVAQISGKGITVEFTVNAQTAKVNGNEVPITNSAGEAMPVLTFRNSSGGDNFYLPAAFICDTFGIKIYWDTKTGTVTFYE